MQDEDALYEQGNQAEELLKNNTFNSIVNSLVEEAFQGFVNSKPEEADQREQSYFHYRGLVGVVHTLKQRVAIRDEILTKRETEANDNSGE